MDVGTDSAVDPTITHRATPTTPAAGAAPVVGAGDAFDAPCPPGPQGEPVAEMSAGEAFVVPVVEETARIEKRSVETGRVRVGTRTEAVEQVLRECLRSDAVGVTRVPVNRTLTEGEPVPVMREEGGVTVIPVLEEVLVVEKRLVLKEEVHVRRTTSGEDVEVPVTLRRQRAVVERVGADGAVAAVEDPVGEENQS